MTLYASSASPRPRRWLVNPLPGNSPLVFLVIRSTPVRLQVMLPTRPNLSSAWIARRDVVLALNRFRVDVRLHRHRMTIWRDGNRLASYPIGVGRRAVTPTPFGLYYITVLLKQSDPNGAYGPYAYGLSAHSDVLHEFAGGDGEIGIHGTDDPASVGNDVSHGCIRVRNDVITRLARILPLGTPVQIEP